MMYIPLDLRVFGIFPKFGNPDDNNYEKDQIPKKLKHISNHVEKIEINIKQPVSRSGFKRGQRN